MADILSAVASTGAANARLLNSLASCVESDRATEREFVHLDDVLIECDSLPAPATGRVGLFQGEGGNAISSLKAWGINK